MSARRWGSVTLPMRIHKITRWSVDAVHRVVVPGRAGVPAGRRRPPASAHRRAGVDQRDPRRAEPVLEARSSAEGPRVAGVARHLRGGAPTGGRAELPALAGQRPQPLRDRRRARRLARPTDPKPTWRRFAECGAGAPEDRGHRSAVLRAMRAQSMEFSELNVEFGYTYDSAAVVPDGSPAPVSLDDIRVYEPSTRPGAPLPHAWIDDEDGHRRALARPRGARAVPAHRRRGRRGLV